MAWKAQVVGVLVGRKNTDNIYVKSASGNVYLLKESTRKEQLAINPKQTAQSVVARIKERGTIDTRYFTKIRG